MKPSGYRYVGREGQHLSGIPARDLTPEEAAALSDQDRQRCLGSGLYKEEKPVSPAKTKKEGDQ